MEGSKRTHGKGNRVLHPEPLSEKSGMGSPAKAREGNRVLHTSKEVGIAYESVRSILGSRRHNLNVNVRLRSLDFVFLAQRAPILPDHPHFLATQTSVLDRHAEERVLILLIVGGESILVK
jgi:hypothetical protein